MRRPRVVLAGLGLLLLLSPTAALATEQPTQRAIVQAASAEQAADLVRAAGGSVHRELSIIQAVSARLTPTGRARLERHSAVRRVWADGTVRVAGKNGGKGAGEPFSVPSASFPSQVDADRLHAQGITGDGVTVAFLDTGLVRLNAIKFDSYDRKRVLAAYDAVRGRSTAENKGDDGSGHGTHVMTVATGSDVDDNGDLVSIAPGASLVSVRAFGDDGSGTYADVLAGLQWLLDNRDAYGIDIVNLSFSAEPQSHYWDDPINQAVMRLWQNGILVVASAGNRGPDAMTIGVPGNVPYVVTVGAMGDATLPITATEQHVAVFSSAGPTFEGFVKPEIIAPGSKLLGVMSFGSQIAEQHSEFAFNKRFFRMSGTSQAAAVVSGVAALMLQHSPQLTPDEVKYRLMDAARPAAYTSGSGALAYSIFQQGAGLVNAYDAVHSTAAGKANRGLDVGADLDGTRHYRGMANAYASGNGYVYYVADEQGNLIGDGFLWSDDYFAAQGFLWSDVFAWSDGMMWSDAMMWSDGLMWSDAMMWSDAFLWADAQTLPAAVNTWVPQE